MSRRDHWRGDRRIRVTLELGPRSARVADVRLLDGPAVQRPALDGTHVAHVQVGGRTVLLQSFDDPLLVRGVPPPGEIGHSFARRDRGVIFVDVPVGGDVEPGAIAIRVVDLSSVERRPTDLAAVQRLVTQLPRAARVRAAVSEAELTQHPRWAALGLPGGPAEPREGHFEIYVDEERRYRWRLRRPDGQIVADSGQGYDDRAALEADLRWIRAHAPAVDVHPLDLG